MRSWPRARRIPKNCSNAASAALRPHDVVDGGYGQVESGAWYLARWPDGHDDLDRIVGAFAQPLVATRTIPVSPFAGEGETIYFAGYDANKAPAHNTAWVARTTLAAALGGSP